MWFAIIVTLILYRLYVTCTKRKSFPPGPIAFPIIGHLPLVWLSLKKYKYHHVVWKQWSKKYGNLLGLRLGSIDAVVVSGRELINEVLTREEFDGRPDGLAYLMRSFGKKLGIVFSEGATWNKSRKTVLKGLRNFGFSSRSMEYDIIEECNALIEYIIQMPEKAINVNQLCNVTIINILWKLVAGKRYDINDERLNKLCSLITRSFKALNMSGGILSALPWLRLIVPGLVGYTELKTIHEELHVFYKKTIDEHKSSIDLNSPRDVIDVLLIDMMQNKESFTLEEIHVICVDLLEAGLETVNNTVVFLLLHLLLNENVQRKLQQEIDTQVGSRKPVLEDRSRLVYAEATILEALRISTVAVMGVPHKVMEDAKLGDYIIPKGTYLLMSLHELHNCGHWGDPTEFRPERFITKDNKVRHDDRLIPFGLGKRRCLGEGVARSELFIFLTHLLQRFNLRQPENDPPPSTEPVDGITLSAQDFRIVFEPRF